jgi:hypothetical protein
LVTAELWEALSREGNRQALLGNYPEAAARFNLTQEIAEQLGDRRGVAAALLGQGTVHRMGASMSRLWSIAGRVWR